MDTVVSGLFNSVVENFHAVGVVSSDSSAAAETVYNAYIVEHILSYSDICAETLNFLGEAFVVIPCSIAYVDMLWVTDSNTA